MKKTVIILIIFTILTDIYPVTAANNFKCSYDCEQPQPGYFLIGCTTNINQVVKHDEGGHIPSGSSNGYVYMASRTHPSYNEVIICEYWREDKPLPNDNNKTLNVKSEKESISRNIQYYNDNINKLPKVVMDLFGNERMHIYLKNQDGSTSEFATITEKGLIVEGTTWLDEDGNGVHDLWQEKGIDPTMTVYIDEEQLMEIASSGNSWKTFGRAWGKGIRYEGLNYGSSFRKLIVDIGVTLYSYYDDSGLSRKIQL